MLKTGPLYPTEFRQQMIEARLPKAKAKAMERLARLD